MIITTKAIWEAVQADPAIQRVGLLHGKAANILYNYFGQELIGLLAPIMTKPLNALRLYRLKGLYQRNGLERGFFRRMVLAIREEKPDIANEELAFWEHLKDYGEEILALLRSTDEEEQWRGLKGIVTAEAESQFFREVNLRPESLAGVLQGKFTIGDLLVSQPGIFLLFSVFDY